MAAKQPRQPAGAISTILTGLRRAPRQIRRGSRDVIETAVSQLFDAAVQPHGAAASGEYRIDELARLADTTTRNIRVYRDRGLLHPELTASATAAEAAAVREESFDAYASVNRTCELAMARATGAPYRHLLELVEEATR